MGEESSAENGGDKKPDANQNSQGRQGGRRGKGKKKHNNGFNSDKGDKAFAGQTEEIGVFTATQNRAESTAQYTDTLKSIVTYAAKTNPRTSKSIEKGRLILPEPIDVNTFLTTATDAEGKSITSQLTADGKDKYNAACKRREKKVEAIEEDLMRIHQMVWNNCDATVQDALKQDKDFDKMDDNMDVLALLAKIKSLTFTGTTTTCRIRALVALVKEVFGLTQGKNTTVATYDERLTSVLKAGDEMFGGEDQFIGIFDPVLTSIIAMENGDTVDAISEAKKEQYAKQGRDRMKGMMFTLGTDRSRYGDAVDQMNQDFLKNNKSYPPSQRSACTLFRNIKVKTKPRHQDRDDDGHQFNVTGDESGGGGGDNRKCYRCGRIGHIASNCGEASHVNGHMLHTMGEVVDESSPPVEDGVADTELDDGEIDHEF